MRYILLLASLLLASCTATVSNTDNDANSNQTYTNAKHGYSLSYPSSLAVREYSDTQDGAGFRPAEMESDPANEVIAVGAFDRPQNHVGTDFDDYVRIAAAQEIEGYETLETMDIIETNSGVTCYITTWRGRAPQGQFLSQPIVYCPLEDSNTLQFALLNPEHEETFNEMVRSVDLP